MGRMRFIETWEAMRVTRKHTMVNIRAENTAEHSWGVLHLLLMLYPSVPVRVIYAAQYHDFGEMATGDMPGNVRWANPDLGALLERLENDFSQELLPPHIYEQILQTRPEEWLLIEICDRMEFCIGEARERRMGNRFAMIYFERSFNKAKAAIDKLLEEPGSLGPDVRENVAGLFVEMNSEKLSLERLA